MDLLRVRRLFADEQVARLGHTGPGGRPFLAPVRFAVIDDGDAGVVVCTLDVQPRSLAAAMQLRAIPQSPRVSFLADGLDETRSGWWVRADAVAEVLRRHGDDPRFSLALAALRERYPGEIAADDVYSIVWSTITEWSGWVAGVAAA